MDGVAPISGLARRPRNAVREEGREMAVKTWAAMVVASSLVVAATAGAGEKQPDNAPACTGAVDDYFAKEVWAKVGSALCVNCHREGGDAEGSRFVLQDPRKVQGHAQDEALRHNRDAFCRMARMRHGDQSRLLVKVTGGLKHGGADVLKADSRGYRILVEFVRRIDAPPSAASRPIADDKDLPPFFDGVVMLDPDRLLRRTTLSLAGRL